MVTMAMGMAITRAMPRATRWWATKRVIAIATRGDDDGNKEGNGKGGKSNGDGDEEGNGKG
jgi:hypothetical protein